MKPLRVGHFLLDARIGGPQSYVMWLRSTCTRFSHTIFAHGHSEYVDMSFTCLRSIHKSMYAVDIVVAFITLLIIELFPSRKRVDLYHIHGVDNLAPVAVAILISKPALWHIHECYSQLPFEAAIKRVVQYFPNIRVVVTSLESFSLQGLGAADFIPPQVDNLYWSRPFDISQMTAGENPAGIFCIANISPVKGLHTLVEAISRLEYPIVLTVAGAFLDSQSRYLKYLRKLISKSPKIHSIRLVGFLSQKEIRKELEKNRVLVSASESESFPLALVQGMYSSIFIVCTDVGDNAELLSDYPRKEVFPARSVDHLANAISRSLFITQHGGITRYDMSSNSYYALGRASRIESVYRDLVE